MGKRTIVFVTGTRADFGKLKPLMRVAQNRSDVHLSVFATGMHMLHKYGHTWLEVERSGFRDVHPFINQNADDSMASVLGKTVLGFTDYLRERSPNLIVVHGDRLEALACASVGALNATLVAHVEGGEVSGTVDEMMRHAISKLSHVHLVANDQAARNLIQMGESCESIHVIGSPDIDVMDSPELPPIEHVLDHYSIPFSEFGILLFHPVTTSLSTMEKEVRAVVDAVLGSGIPHIVIYPNNDAGSRIILNEYRRFRDGGSSIRVLPSMSFERFLTALKHAWFIVGNSSAGIREAPHFGVPSINVGSRQAGRLRSATVVDVDADRAQIMEALCNAVTAPHVPSSLYGRGRSAELFGHLLDSGRLWDVAIQKQLIIR